MRKLLITLPLVAAAAVGRAGRAIAFGGPGEPRADASITDPFKGIDYLRPARAPPLRRPATAQRLAYRAYAPQGTAARQRGAGARLVGQQRQHARAGPGAGRIRLGRLCAGHARPWRIGHQGADRLCRPARRRPGGLHAQRAAGAPGHAGRLLGRRRLRAARRRRRAADAVRPVPAARALHQPGRAHLPCRTAAAGSAWASRASWR